MMMKTIPIFFICIVVLLNSCEKDDTEKLPHTIVIGQIVSTGSQKPVGGVMVYMYDGYPSSILDVSDKHKVTNNRDSTMTNVNGYFQLELDGYEPVIYPYKKGFTFEYHIEGAVIGIMPLSAGNVYDSIKINLDAIAYFNPVIMNKLPQNENDALKVYLYGRYSTYYDVASFSGNGPFKYFRWDEKGMIVLGDSYTKYKIDFQRVGIWNSMFDSVYINVMEIYKDTIYY
jgi:hypothetical protein